MQETKSINTQSQLSPTDFFDDNDFEDDLDTFVEESSPATSPPLLSAQDMNNLVEERPSSTKAGPRLISAFLVGTLVIGIAYFLTNRDGGGSPQTIATSSNQPTSPDKPISSADKDEIDKGNAKLATVTPQGVTIPIKPSPAPAPNNTGPRRISPPVARPQIQQLQAYRQPVQSIPARSVPQPIPRTSFRSEPISYSPKPDFYASVKNVQPQEDPETAAKRLASLGVIVDGGGSSAPTNYSQPIAAPVSVASLGYDSPASVDLGDLPSSPSPVRTGTGSYSVTEGETAKAKLSEPIAWNRELDISSRTYKATLSQKFGAIPKGAIISLQPDSRQQSRTSGLISLTVSGFTINGQYYNAPNGIQVTASDNAPIVAKQITPGKGGLLRDIGNIALGVGGTVLSGDSSVGSNEDLVTQFGLNAADNMIGRASSALNSRPTGDRSYFKFDGSIKLIAAQGFSL